MYILPETFWMGGGKILYICYRNHITRRNNRFVAMRIIVRSTFNLKQH